MNDQEFLQRFHDGALPGEEFRHRGHLRLASLVLQRHGLEEAIRNISAGIKHYANLKGAESMYNETLTQFWVRLVDHAQQTNTSSLGFEQLINRFPILLDKQLPFYHWRPETLGGSTARSRWLEPDLKPLPF